MIDLRVLAGQLRTSWNVYRADGLEERERLPKLEAEHAAHVAGFVGGLMASGCPESIARSLATNELMRDADK